MRILICNDDGHLAPGIVALVEQLKTIAEVIVVAPEANRSGASSAITLDRPLLLERAANGFYYVNGTPADCVHVAITALLDSPPDLVVSGINQGQNMGDDTLYSGTVAAAMEGYLFGVPAMAFSQVEKGWAHVDSAARVAKDMVLRYKELLPMPYLMNVNIPNLPYDSLKPAVATRLGRRNMSEPVRVDKDPYGKTIYWIGPFGLPREADEGTDFYATQHGHVSVTPLQIDWTSAGNLDLLKKALT